LKGKTPVKLSIVASAYSLDRYKDGEIIIVIDENKELYNRTDEYISSNNLHGMKLVFNSENKGLSTRLTITMLGRLRAR